jgi:hypothetical protein
MLFQDQMLRVSTLARSNQSATTHRSLLASGSGLPAVLVPQPQPLLVVALFTQLVSW